MADGRPAILSRDAISQLNQFRHGKIDDSPGFNTDHLIVWCLAIGHAIVGLLLIVQNLFDDAGIDEKFNRPINSGLGNTHLAVPHFKEQLIRLKNAIHLDDRIQNLGTLGRELQVLTMQMLSEYGAERDNIIVCPAGPMRTDLLWLVVMSHDAAMLAGDWN